MKLAHIIGKHQEFDIDLDQYPHLSFVEAETPQDSKLCSPISAEEAFAFFSEDN